jgi:hypothetical protein
MTSAPLWCSGCVIDDHDNSVRSGPTPAPTASVPDAGSPIRRESAAETLKDADPAEPARGDATLEVAPGSRTPPPPVQ